MNRVMRARARGTGVHRLVAAGTTSTPEPATLSLWRFGAAIPEFARRRRTDQKGRRLKRRRPSAHILPPLSVVDPLDDGVTLNG